MDGEELATFNIGQQIAKRDIYNAQVINVLVKAVESFSTDYSNRIQSFLKHYLGSEDRPIPFGGRADVLRKLDNWLDDPEKPPYLLLAGSAGQGKSTLLVRWIQTLLSKKNLTVIFIPISIRFRTNQENFVFFALTAGLASFYNDDMPNPDMPSEILRDRVFSYLSRRLPEGRRILIILDAIDEASDWEIGSDLLSNYYSNNIRIVVSARYLAGDADASSWMSKLGWDQSDLACSIDLHPLDQEGVADVLQQMGPPLANLAQRVDIVSQIYRLSQGDPLVVQLYIEDLWSERKNSACLQPEDLSSLKPGLKAYLFRWWSEQCKRWESQNRDRIGKKPTSEPLVREVLNIFSCALGPLSRNDILSIISPNFEKDDHLLKDALGSLDRIIIGDGINQDYVFSHPRFGSYFYDDLSDIERKKIESRFISYGEETIKFLKQGKILPKDVSRYLVQHYGKHLHRANCSVEMLLPLLSNGWLKAWEAQEGAYSGFLDDVKRAWEAIETADLKKIEAGNKATYLADAIRCALCFASVNGLSSNTPSELITLLVANKVWTPAQGLAYARQSTYFEERAKALLKLSSQFKEPQNADILREALAAAREIRDNYGRSDALAKIAPNPPDPEGVDVLREALAAARKIEFAYMRYWALARIAPNLPDPQEALAVAREIENKYFRSRALARVAPNLPDPEKVDVLREALAVARGIRENYQRSDALASIASVLPDPEKVDILREALAVAREIKYGYDRSCVLTRVAPNLPDPQEALAVAREIEDEQYRSDALTSIASNLPDPEKVDILREALAVAREIEDEHDRSIALNAIVARLIGFSDITLYSFWREHLRFMAHCDQRNLLSVLITFIPVIAALCNSKAFVEIVHDIQDMESWWL